MSLHGLLWAVTTNSDSKAEEIRKGVDPPMTHIPGFSVEDWLLWYVKGGSWGSSVGICKDSKVPKAPWLLSWGQLSPACPRGPQPLGSCSLFLMPVSKSKPHP